MEKEIKFSMLLTKEGRLEIYNSLRLVHKVFLGVSFIGIFIVYFLTYFITLATFGDSFSILESEFSSSYINIILPIIVILIYLVSMFGWYSRLIEMLEISDKVEQVGYLKIWGNVRDDAKPLTRGYHFVAPWEEIIRFPIVEQNGSVIVIARVKGLYGKSDKPLVTVKVNYAIKLDASSNRRLIELVRSGKTETEDWSNVMEQINNRIKQVITAWIESINYHEDLARGYSRYMVGAFLNASMDRPQNNEDALAEGKYIAGVPGHILLKAYDDTEQPEHHEIAAISEVQKYGKNWEKIWETVIGVPCHIDGLDGFFGQRPPTLAEEVKWGRNWIKVNQIVSDYIINLGMKDVEKVFYDLKGKTYSLSNRLSDLRKQMNQVIAGRGDFPLHGLGCKIVSMNIEQAIFEEEFRRGLDAEARAINQQRADLVKLETNRLGFEKLRADGVDSGVALYLASSATGVAPATTSLNHIEFGGGVKEATQNIGKGLEGLSGTIVQAGVEKDAQLLIEKKKPVVK